jgi:hypothetical protein
MVAPVDREINRGLLAHEKAPSLTGGDRSETGSGKSDELVVNVVITSLFEARVELIPTLPP